jgi:hypothetical protein
MFELSNPEPAAAKENASLPILRRELRNWTRDLAIALVLALFIIIFLYRPVKVINRRPARISIVSPGKPITRLMKDFVRSSGYQKTTTSPRSTGAK